MRAEAAAWIDAEGRAGSIPAPGRLVERSAELRALVTYGDGELLSYYAWCCSKRPADPVWQQRGRERESFLLYRARTVEAVLAARRQRLAERGIAAPTRVREWRTFRFLELVNQCDGAPHRELKVFGVDGVPACDYWVGAMTFTQHVRLGERPGSALPELALVCVVPEDLAGRIDRANAAASVPCLEWADELPAALESA